MKKTRNITPVGRAKSVNAVKVDQSPIRALNKSTGSILSRYSALRIGKKTEIKSGRVTMKTPNKTPYPVLKKSE
jgi:hypothetical protein